MSRSALTSGIEWNYHFDSLRDSGNFSRFYETFEDLFYRHSILIDDQELARYSREWKKPAVQRDLEKYDPVSYTHLDVYKRQRWCHGICAIICVKI